MYMKSNELNEKPIAMDIVDIMRYLSAIYVYICTIVVLIVKVMVEQKKNVEEE